MKTNIQQIPNVMRDSSFIGVWNTPYEIIELWIGIFASTSVHPFGPQIWLSVKRFIVAPFTLRIESRIQRLSWKKEILSCKRHIQFRRYCRYRYRVKAERYSGN